MRKIWVKVDPWDKEIVTTALEGGADGIMVPPGYSDKVKALGRIETISEDGDLKLGEDVIIFNVKSGADEEEIVTITQSKKPLITPSLSWASSLPINRHRKKNTKSLSNTNLPHRNKSGLF